MSVVPARFRATLVLGGKTATGVEVPPEVIAELGAGIRGGDDRLAVRPGSPALAVAVSAWSDEHGAAAVRGDLGAGRDGNEIVV